MITWLKKRVRWLREDFALANTQINEIDGEHATIEGAEARLRDMARRADMRKLRR